MTIINHNEAIRLENIVFRVYKCRSGGVGGLASARLFEQQPFSAAVLSLSPFYLKQNENKEIEQFLSYYTSLQLLNIFKT